MLAEQEIDLELEQEFDEQVGFDMEDIQVHYREAFVALWPAVDQRWNDEMDGEPFNAARWQEAIEKFYAEIKRSRQTLAMMDGF